MYPYLETIKLQDAVFFRLKYHQLRMDRVLTDGEVVAHRFSLEDVLHQSAYPVNGLFKCRILYGTDSYNISFEPYVRRRIETLKLIEADIEQLNYKSADRSIYQKAFGLRGNCDDVLIVCKGLLTDTSYANIALFDGSTWFTPKEPLIPGTNRAMLLDHNIITEADIGAHSINTFQKIRIFNAMIEFGEIELPVSKITI
jgi:4-amino-4-deoxychorismate lyase